MHAMATEILEYRRALRLLALVAGPIVRSAITDSLRRPVLFLFLFQISVQSRKQLVCNLPCATQLLSSPAAASVRIPADASFRPLFCGTT